MALDVSPVESARVVSAGVRGTAGALPADRRARPDRRPAHRRARRHRRDDRLVLLPALRLAERLRGDPRRRPRRPVPHLARLRRLELQAALPPRHQRPHHALPDARRSRRGAGLHASAAYGRGGAPPPHDPPGGRRARPDALRRRRRPALRLRARPPRGRAHPARRAASALPTWSSASRRAARSRSSTAATSARASPSGPGRRPPSCSTASNPARCRCRTPMPTSPPSSTPPWRSGGAGCAARATAGAGARWCIARRSRSSCSPTRPPARSSPPPPPACRRSSAAHATGTTATRGCATPPSRSTRCSGSGSPRRPARSWSGWRGASATQATASRGRCRSCTASTGARTCPRRSSRTWRATWARRRCGSATARRPSCSSTSTAS